MHPTSSAARWRSALFYLAAFVLIGVVLASTNWTAISAINHEQGDFAANSLLIQDAKSLSLWYGNYSRVGFNHPGPAILYVLAGGEVLFHDWLHVVSSPFSGQLLAVGFYTAGWTLLLFAMLRRISGSSAGTLLFLAVFALTSAYNDYMVFDGIWFPHLYFFPFAAMLVAISRLASGQADMLRALALSTGFLINGHVSFVAILGIVLLVALAGNWALSSGERTLRVLSPAFLRQHRRVLLQAVAILALFLLPLVVATCIDPPGPIVSYLRYGRNNQSHHLREAAGFVAMYWGGASAVLMGLALAGLLYFGAGAGQAGRAARGLLLALAGATLGLLYYAKVGIDQLSLKYIGLFYYTVPALLLALAALFCYRASQWQRKRWAAGALTLLALVMTFREIKRPPEYTYAFNLPKVDELYQQVHRVAQAHPGRRVVFDLEPTDGWNDIWSTVLGLQLYAKRQHQELLCVNENWHISFTRGAKCRPEELNGPRYDVRVNSGPDAIRGTPEISGAGLALYNFNRPLQPMPDAATVLAQPQLFKAAVLGEGWSAVENDFVWSLGQQAELALYAAPGKQRQLQLDVSAFLPPGAPAQQLTVLINGKAAGTFNFSSNDNRKQVQVQVGADDATDLHIKLQIAKPMSPLEFGQGNDDRKLGVAFYGYAIKDKQT